MSKRKKKTKKLAKRKPKPEIVEAEVVEEETSLVPVTSNFRSDALFALAVSKLSANTRKAYEQDLRRFSQWWGTPHVLQALVSLQAGEAREVVLRYQSDLLDKGLSKNTVARAMRCLNSIVKKLHFAEKVPWTLDIPVGKVTAYKDVRGPGGDAWKALIEHAEQDRRWFGFRDVAIFRLLGNDGFRAGEIGTIMYPDHVRTSVDHGPEVYVQGKGDKDLWQPVHPKTWEAIEEWLAVREEHLSDGEPGETWHGPLFFSNRTNRLSGKAIWYLVTKRAKAAGLGHIHPHQLRHHAITVRAKKWKGPQAALTDWARHADPRTTKVYIDDVSDQTRRIADLGDD